MNAYNASMLQYTQGVMGDGPVICANGAPMTPEQIVAVLNMLADEVVRLRGIINNPSGKPYASITARE